MTASLCFFSFSNLLNVLTALVTTSKRTFFITMSEMDVDEGGSSVVAPQFPAFSESAAAAASSSHATNAPRAGGGRTKGGPRAQSSIQRRIPVPAHRRTPLRNNWMQIYTPLVEQLMLQVRYNTKLNAVEIRAGPSTVDPAAVLQKGEDFLRAFVLGFAPEDAVALLRLDDLYVDSFDVLEVKSSLKGDNLARAIGRIAGKDGRAKFTIENATRTRIVVADKRVHILGSVQNIKMARDAICMLILGSPINKVFANLQSVASRARAF